MEHITVLLEETIDHLAVKSHGVYVDATLGGGGHAEALLRRLSHGRLIAFDQDPYALQHARPRLGGTTNEVELIAANFATLEAELHARNLTQVDGILMDIGVSSFQLDDPTRGFSYHHEAPLDMRMNPSDPQTAADLVNGMDETALKALFTAGEVPFTNRLVEELLKARAIQPITTTLGLVAVVQQAAPRAERQKRHPARLVFQALRMALNQELVVLQAAIEQALRCLKVEGRLAIITFHSLEDRVVKQAFVKASTLDIPKGLPVATQNLQADFKIITKKPVVPSPQEEAANPRSRSAKLRVIERIQ